MGIRSTFGKFLRRTFRAGAYGGDVYGSPAALGAGRKTLAGERVDTISAMRYGPYYAAIGNIAEDLAKLPKCVVESLVPRGRNPISDDPVTSIFSDSFNLDCSAFVGVECLTQWAMGWGNGVAEIERTVDGSGVVALWPIHPSRVTMKIVAGRPRYFVRADDISTYKVVEYAPEEIFHLRGRGDQYQGWSLAQLHAEAIGYGLAARGFAATFFGNDLNIGMVATLKGKIPPSEREQFRKDTTKAYREATQAHGLFVLDNEATLTRMGVPPSDAQMIEAQEFSVEEWARVARIPQHKIGHLKRATGWSTNEGANTDYVVDTLLPWEARWASEAKRKLLVGRPRVALKFYFQGLLRGDFKTRTEGYARMISGGIMTPNEARELEDMNPSDDPNADKLIVNGTMRLLEGLGSDPAPAPPVSPDPSFPPETPAEDSTDATDAPDPIPPAPEEPPADAAASPAVLAMIESASKRVARKVTKAYERHAAKHAGDLPAFTRWARGFAEGMRTDFIENFTTSVASPEGFAAVCVPSLGRALLAQFAEANPDPAFESRVATNLGALAMEHLR